MADKIINQSLVTTDSSDRIKSPTSSGVKTLTASGLLLGFSLWVNHRDCCASAAAMELYTKHLSYEHPSWASGEYLLRWNV